MIFERKDDNGMGDGTRFAGNHQAVKRVTKPYRRKPQRRKEGRKEGKRDGYQGRNKEGQAKGREKKERRKGEDIYTTKEGRKDTKEGTEKDR